MAKNAQFITSTLFKKVFPILKKIVSESSPNMNKKSNNIECSLDWALPQTKWKKLEHL